MLLDSFTFTLGCSVRWRRWSARIWLAESLGRVLRSNWVFARYKAEGERVTDLDVFELPFRKSTGISWEGVGCDTRVARRMFEEDLLFGADYHFEAEGVERREVLVMMEFR